MLLPSHLEQFLLARRVVEMGAGSVLSAEQAATELPTLMQDLLNNPACADNAGAFAQKYASFGQASVIENLVRRVHELVSGEAKK